MASPQFDALRDVQRVAEGQGRTAALANRRKIENGIENLLHSGGLRTFSRTARFLSSASVVPSCSGPFEEMRRVSFHGRS